MAFHPREGGRKIPFKPMSRRDFMRRSAMTAAGVSGTAAFLAACKSQSSSLKVTSVAQPARQNHPVTLPVNQNDLIQPGMKPEAGPLKLYNWQDYINPRTIKLAEQALGVNIVVTTFNTMQEAISKLTSTSSDVDIFFPTKDYVSRLVAVGLLRPLQHSYIPNLANCWDTLGGGSGSVATQYPFYDQGSNYTVPYAIYTTGIGYRVDKGPNANITKNLAPLAEQIPAMPVPYDILWDTTYKGYVHLLDDYREVPAMAMVRKGMHDNASSDTLRTDVNTDDPSTRAALIKQATDDVVQWQQTMQGKMDISDYTDLPEAQSYIHQGWSGDFVSVQYYYPNWSPKDIIRYWYPPTTNYNWGGVVGSDTMAILSGGKNPVLAHMFLNYMLDFNNSMVNFMWNGYMPPQKQITQPEALLKNPPNGIKPLTPYNIIPDQLGTCVVTEEQFKLGYELLELTPDVNNQWQNMWQVIQNA